jgi:2-C-methyl-D-erythritol 4-phosphate cytidylyltransferase / 2-C-methyl-D-erythritol 2,4-cyclodiphosphate synthase
MDHGGRDSSHSQDCYTPQWACTLQPGTSHYNSGLPPRLFVSAIIAAGGRGQRFGTAVPKQLFSIGGRSILERSVRAFLAHPLIDEVVVALPADLVAAPPAFLQSTHKPLRIIPGGEKRSRSVAEAFRHTAQHADIVVVHDAARPFVSSDLIRRTVEAAAESGAALAALPARDTVKMAAESAGERVPSLSHDVADQRRMFVRETLPREAIFLAQTPQAFRRDLLREAMALDEDATDEAALVEKIGHSVRLVVGEPSNIKVTVPEDIAIAEAIARSQEAAVGSPHSVRSESAPRQGEWVAALRIGLGYDLHRLVKGRRLILGGVEIPFERGLHGHSDADAICHAVTDAVLGAAAAGDIGRHFPDGSAEWAGASSLNLLRRASAIVRDSGYAVANVDVVVIAERPKLGPYIDAMCRQVAGALDLPATRVAIKGKTNEGVGELGRNEAIAVHAVALLVRTQQ